MSELRIGLRVLRRRPGDAFTMIATLALGIAAETAVFTLVDRVLLQPLPIPDAPELVLVRQQNPQGTSEHVGRRPPGDRGAERAGRTVRAQGRF